MAEQIRRIQLISIDKGRVLPPPSLNHCNTTAKSFFAIHLFSFSIAKSLDIPSSLKRPYPRVKEEEKTA